MKLSKSLIFGVLLWVLSIVAAGPLIKRETYEQKWEGVQMLATPNPALVWKGNDWKGNDKPVTINMMAEHFISWLKGHANVDLAPKTEKPACFIYHSGLWGKLDQSKISFLDIKRKLWDLPNVRENCKALYVDTDAFDERDGPSYKTRPKAYAAVSKKEFQREIQNPWWHMASLTLSLIAPRESIAFVLLSSGEDRKPVSLNKVTPWGTLFGQFELPIVTLNVPDTTQSTGLLGIGKIRELYRVDVSVAGEKQFDLSRPFRVWKKGDEEIGIPIKVGTDWTSVVSKEGADSWGKCDGAAWNRKSWMAALASPARFEHCELKTPKRPSTLSRSQ